MRRYAFIVMAVVFAACGRQQVEVSEQSVQFAAPSSRDSTLARVAVELTQMGFAIGGRHENLIFTAPRPLPVGAGVAGGAAAGPGGSEQLWFVHVVSDNRLFRGGSNTRVRGFFLPQTGNLSAGNVLQENAEQITSARPEAFRELRRVAERLQAAALR